MLAKRSNSFFKSKTFGFVKVLSISVVLLGIFTKCYVPSEYLESDLIPEDERLGVEIDTTFILSAHTVSYDNIIDTRGFTEIVLGAANSNVFGHVKSSFISQIGLTSANFKFKQGSILDSAVLYLNLKAFYGDKSETLNVSMYELSESLIVDSTYNNYLPNMYPTPIGTATYQGESKLRIPLTYDFANKLFTADSIHMARQDSFLNYIKGLYITTSSVSSYKKAMYYFNLTDAANSITLFYRAPNANLSLDTLQFKYQFSQSALRSLVFEHDHSTASPATAILNLNNTTTQDSVFYLQGLGGTRGLIKLEGLSDWANKMPVIINRAELRIEPEQVPISIFEPDSVFTEINIFKKNSANQYSAITDLQYYSGTFGGNYIKYKGYYSFNITNHLQEQLQSTTPNLDIYLEPRSRFARASQTILKTANNSKKIKLIVTYTKL
jgi:hypothetical protein